MTDLNQVFNRLREILRPYAAKLELTVDSTTNYCLYTRHIMQNKQPLHFASVQIRKRYVSYYLMPVYVRPKLLDGISAELRKRMQGKSCFNFTTVDEPLFKELARLTKAGFMSYREQEFV